MSKGLAKRIAKALVPLWPEEFRRLEEADAQASRLPKVWKVLRPKVSTFLRLIVANALVSYQLSGKGEDYWVEFAEYFSLPRAGGLLEKMEAFLRQSRANRRLRSQKLLRLRKALPVVQALEGQSMEEAWHLLKPLGEEKKTVRFALKMYGYGLRVVEGKFLPFPMEVGLPVDSRIARLTRAITEERPEAFWRRVGLLAGIPPLHVDSLLYLLADPLTKDPSLLTDAVAIRRLVKTYVKRTSA